MRFWDFVHLVKSDLWRHCGKANVRLFIINLLCTPGFAYVFWMRFCYYLRQHLFFRYGCYHLAKFVLRHCRYKYGISIEPETHIGSGFYIGHFGCIFVAPDATIGDNCNLSHGVTIGRTYRGERAGVPNIGMNVYIGPGAKIIGKVLIGNNVAIGANCVVTKDISDNAVVVGMPGRVISYTGSDGYITRTNYPCGSDKTGP
jgi:serine O-acetyltransferase